MIQIKTFLKKYFEYINIGIVGTLLFFGCFHSMFAIALLGYMFVMSLFLKTEQILKYQIILRIFMGVLSVIPVSSIFPFILGYVKNFIVDVMFKKKKINIKPILVILVLSVYNLLNPIYKLKTLDYIASILFYLMVYFIYEKRKEIDFVSVAKFFCYTLVVSCVFSFLIPYSPNLEESRVVMYVNGLVRFTGLCVHSNIFAYAALIAIALLFVLKYYDKISTPEFLVLYIIIFVFGYLTIARAFALIFIVTYLLFAILYLMKYGMSEFRFVCSILAIVLSICLIMNEETYAYIFRIENSAEKENLGNVEKDFVEQIVVNDWWKMMYDGQIYFDQGRLNGWILYYGRITQTLRSLFFGYGISAPDIGTMHAHNIVLQTLYNNGIVGTLLIVLFGCSMIEFKEFKNWKKYLGVALLAICYSGTLFLDNNTFSVVVFAMIIVAASNIDKINKKQEKINYCKMLKEWKEKPLQWNCGGFL